MYPSESGLSSHGTILADPLGIYVRFARSVVAAGHQLGLPYQIANLLKWA